MSAPCCFKIESMFPGTVDSRCLLNVALAQQHTVCENENENEPMDLVTEREEVKKTVENEM